MKPVLDLGIIMPQTPYPKLLAFIEGTMERRFVNNNFHYVDVVPVSNGTGWSVSALCNQIATFYRARNFFGDGIIVWIDRERRSETSQAIYLAVQNTLVAAGADVKRLHIMVADLMSENMILSDENLMREIIGVPDYHYVFEGQGGKHKLCSLLKDAGEEYSETATGVRLLKKMRLANCALSSPSVARFVATIDFPCWWFAS